MKGKSSIAKEPMAQLWDRLLVGAVTTPSGQSHSQVQGSSRAEAQFCCPARPTGPDSSRAQSPVLGEDCVISWLESGCVYHCSSWWLAGVCMLRTCLMSQPFQGQLEGSIWSHVLRCCVTPALESQGSEVLGQWKKGSQKLPFILRGRTSRCNRSYSVWPKMPALELDLPRTKSRLQSLTICATWTSDLTSLIPSSLSIKWT